MLSEALESPLKTTPLPECAQVIAEVIGRSATLALAQGCQYRILYVPKRSPLPYNHYIPRTIGLGLTAKLQRAFGGEALPLSRCYSIFAADRNERIRKGYEAGQTVLQLAATFGLCVKQIQNIVVCRRHAGSTVSILEGDPIPPRQGTSAGGMGAVVKTSPKSR